ncbi:uncharacterized protein LY79DRAFT_117904 [Colletotrichum navitas]|uniref:Uncharacterized protein n=1 Tax=Colletotrichum navitas TaxID=681940 RepID=A0AAD8Q4S2_9PEZI|nr:uncharacterized protein LY79DRAFT_117904 [Colletotrichum navitas]KAK1595062.1 hypothetical protein LY79DRAFT_117904 [Colletotrichum navitas]
MHRAAGKGEAYRVHTRVVRVINYQGCGGFIGPLIAELSVCFVFPVVKGVYLWVSSAVYTHASPQKPLNGAGHVNEEGGIRLSMSSGIFTATLATTRDPVGIRTIGRFSEPEWGPRSVGGACRRRAHISSRRRVQYVRVRQHIAISKTVQLLRGVCLWDQCTVPYPSTDTRRGPS